MTVPAAGPNFLISGAYLLVECWADVPDINGFPQQCRAKVPAEDSLGLCSIHRDQMVDA